ncbi:MAG: hypothetical protein AAGC57_05065 [Pseudomonadota bacterium]
MTRTLTLLAALAIATRAPAAEKVTATLRGHAALPALSFAVPPEDAPRELTVSGRFTGPGNQRTEVLGSIEGRTWIGPKGGEKRATGLSLPFVIQNESTAQRYLTGADFDIESIQHVDADGLMWFGDEFDSYLFATNAEGEVVYVTETMLGDRILCSPDHPGPKLPRLPGEVTFGRSPLARLQVHGPVGGQLQALPADRRTDLGPRSRRCREGRRA